ncbi:gp53-like domain-containing protein [Paraburkholderia sp. ZP32-5]|uniref:gp53-like domain-containing protein n=1 Tax=Paraburkholderia sp. ZP32-5 TaxID=2883245 RepID=UPI001F16D994|nr:hypothetical protein [Paraburkholderia sp. ZP32-5]
MATENDFLPFAAGAGANVLSQAAYAALSAVSTGYQSGVAQSAAVNKTLRQSSIMAAVLAQFIVAETGQAAIDDGTTATLLANFTKAVASAAGQLAVLIDTGAANAYAAANPVPLAALPTTTGLVQMVRITHANTGASTYAPDGLASKPIYGLGGQPLQGGELPANGVATLVSFVGSLLNGGNLCWVLYECVGGAQQVGVATASNHAVPLGQMQDGQSGFSSVVTPANGATLDVTMLGELIQVGGGNTYTLAALSTFATGNGLACINSSSAQVATINVTGSDEFNLGSATNVTTFLVQPGQLVQFLKVSGAAWRPVGVSVNAVIPLVIAAATGATHAVPLAQMQAAQGSYAGALTQTPATPMGVSDLGQFVNLSAGNTYTLDAISTFQTGQAINVVYASSTGVATILPSGSDIISSAGFNVASVVVGPGQSLRFVKISSTTWRPEGTGIAANTPVTLAAATAPGQAAQLAQVQVAQGSYAGVQTPANGATFTSSNLGFLQLISALGTYNLDAAANFAAGNSIWVVNTSQVSVITIAANGTDTILVGSAAASTYTVQPGHFAKFTRATTGVWRADSLSNAAVLPLPVAAATASNHAMQLGQVTNTTSPLALATAAAASVNQAVNLGQFGSTLNANGYQKLPSGLIIQWGTTSANSSGIATLTLPITFPNGLYMALANYILSGTPVISASASISSNSTTSQLVAVAQNNGAPINAGGVYFFAIGH